MLVRDPDQLVPNLKTPQPSSMARQVSLRSVLDVALRNGPISRAELARTTGLSKQTTSEVVRVLEESGWLKVSGQTQGGMGRTATTYEVQAHSALVLGVDLGGTKTHVVVADLSGRTLAEIVEPTDLRGGRFVINQIGDLAEKAARQAGVDVRAIRVGVMGSPGVLQQSGAITAAPNIPGLDELSVTDALRRRLGVRDGRGERRQCCCARRALAGLLQEFTYVRLRCSRHGCRDGARLGRPGAPWCAWCGGGDRIPSAGRGSV